MKEGKLSSTLMKRYGITEENAVGKVLWHSLNESGEIGVYDMQFGNTIVRNMLAEDIEPEIVQEHKHAKRDEDEERTNEAKEGMFGQPDFKSKVSWVKANKPGVKNPDAYVAGALRNAGEIK